MEERDYFAWISTVKDIQYTKLNRLLKGVNGIEECIIQVRKNY